MMDFNSDDDKKMKRRSTRGVNLLLKKNNKEEEKEEEDRARRRSTRRMSARFMQTRRTSEIIRGSRRTSVMLKKNFWKDEVLRNGKMQLFELHCALLSTNTLLPPDVITSFFEDAKGNDEYVTIEKLDQMRSKLYWYYNNFGDAPETGIHKQYVIWKDMIFDVEFWIIVIYTLAGLLLVVTTFPVSINIPSHLSLNMSLLASTCYAIGSGRAVFTFPFKKWAIQKKTLEISKNFKEKIQLSAARRYTYDNRPLETEDDKYGYLMMYIKESTMLKDNVIDRLGKRDMDLLLLKELRQIISPEIFGNIWKSMKKDHRSTFEGSELHSYILRKDDESNKMYSTFYNLLSVVKKTISNVSWWMNLSFLSGSCLSFTKKILPLANKELKYVFGTIPTPIMINFLYLIGTLVFTMGTYERKKLSFQMREKAKTILETFSDTPAANEKDDFVINEQKNKLDKTKLNTYLTRRSIALPEKDINLLFDNMDSAKNGVVGKNDIEEYVQKYLVRFRFLSILMLCLKSFEFWSNLVWFFGSLAYVIAVYFPNSEIERIGNEIGALGYLFGAIALLNCLHVKKSFSVSTKYMFYKALSEFLGPRQSQTTSTYTDLTPGSLDIESHGKKERQVSLGNCIFTLDEDDFSTTDDEADNKKTNRKQKFVNVGGYTFPISDSESSSDDEDGGANVIARNLQLMKNNKVAPQDKNLNYDKSGPLSSRRMSIESSEKSEDEYADDESTSTFVTSNIQKRRESYLSRRVSLQGSITSQTISEDVSEDDQGETDTTKNQHNGDDRMDVQSLRRGSTSSRRESFALQSSVASQIISEFDVNENGDAGEQDNGAGIDSVRRGSISIRRGSQALRSNTGNQTISELDFKEYEDFGEQENGDKMNSQSTKTDSSLSRRGSTSSRRGSTSSRRGSTSSRRGSTSSRRGSTSSRRGSTSSRRASQALRSSLASQTISEIDITEYGDFEDESKEDVKDSDSKLKERRMSLLSTSSIDGDKVVKSNVVNIESLTEQANDDVKPRSNRGSWTSSTSPFSSSASRRSSEAFCNSIASQTISEVVLYEDPFDDWNEEKKLSDQQNNNEIVIDQNYLRESELLRSSITSQAISDDRLEDSLEKECEDDVKGTKRSSIQKETTEEGKARYDDSQNNDSLLSSDVIVTNVEIVMNQERQEVSSDTSESNVPQSISDQKNSSKNSVVDNYEYNADEIETSKEQRIIPTLSNIPAEDSKVEKDVENVEKTNMKADKNNEDEEKMLDLV